MPQTTLIENAGDHWLRYGFIRIIKKRVNSEGSISWTLTPWLCLLVNTIIAIKSLLIIAITNPSKEFSIYIGDFNYFFGGLGSRLYINIAYLITGAYPLILIGVLVKDKNKEKAIRCLQMFHMLKIGSKDGLMATLSEVSFRKLNRYTGWAMKMLYPTFAITVIYCALLSSVYIVNLDSWPQLPVALFWVFHYWLDVCSVCTLCYVHSTYFICFCYYVSLALGDLNRKVVLLNQKLVLKLDVIAEQVGIENIREWHENQLNNLNLHPIEETGSDTLQPTCSKQKIELYLALRNRPEKQIRKRKPLNPIENEESLKRIYSIRGKLCRHKEIRQILSNLQLCFTEIRVCDEFFGSLFRAWITMLWFGLISVIFMALQSGTVENLANCLSMATLTFGCVSPYLAASVVVNKLDKTYKLLNRLMLKPMPFTTKWHYLLTIELLASKRKRVGFKVKDWFILNKKNLIKVIYFLNKVIV